MSQQIADLVINLSANSTSFTEQVGRVERQLQLSYDKPLGLRSGYQGCMVLTYLTVSVEGGIFQFAIRLWHKQLQ